jgi:hypothetical protein
VVDLGPWGKLQRKEATQDYLANWPFTLSGILFASY